MEQHIKTLEEYGSFSQKLVLTTACTVLLSSAVGMFVQSFVSSFSLQIPVWAFALLQMGAACAGLWWVNKNGEKKPCA